MNSDHTISVTIDGLEEAIPEGLTLAQMLERRGEPMAVAMVERNGEYVPKRQLDEVVVESGDRIEIILPAFGG